MPPTWTVPARARTWSSRRCGAPPLEEEIVLRAARETFHFRGGEFVLHDMPQDTLKKPRKRLWFHHSDLVFFTGLVRGNFTRDFPELKHDEGLWVSIEKCLDVFNKTRRRHWGVRHPDGGRRPKRQGGDKGDRHSAYFPVIIRATQGHNASIAKNPDTDFALASAYYSTLDKTESASAATRKGVPIVCFPGQLPKHPPGGLSGGTPGQWQSAKLFRHVSRLV